MKTLLKIAFFPLLWVTCGWKHQQGDGSVWNSVVALLSMASLVGILFAVVAIQRGGL